MGIEVRESSGWVQYYDPEIYTSSGWQNILFGEVYTGTGPNNGWAYFYVRINVVDPVITEVSKTQTSITVNVSHTNPDSDLVRVYIYRLDGNGDPINGQYFPSQDGTTGVINQNYTQSSLQLGTTYTFGAYAEYLDANGNVMITSGVDQLSVTTNTYNLYTPSTPSLVKAGYDSAGSGYTGRLTATASSNPLYSQNGSASYIQFELSDGFNPPVQLNSNLTNNDSLQTKSVTFTGLALGTQYVCRARTVYTTIGEVSDWSGFSPATETVDWARQYVPSQTGWTHLANTSAYTGYTSSGTSTKSGSSTSYASSGTNDEWISDPYTTTTGTTNQSRTITSVAYGLGAIEHDTSASHNIVTGVTGTTQVNTITYDCVGAVFTNASFIIFEMTASGASPGGNATIFNSGLSGVDGVTRTIASINFTSGIRQVRFNRGSVAEGLKSSTGILRLTSTSTVGGVTVGSLGGTSALTRVDSDTFARAEPSSPAGGIVKTDASGTVTYPVETTVQVPKDAGSEVLTLWARPTGLPDAVRDVQLESLSYTHGGIASSSVGIIVNGNSVTTRSVSADATFTSVTPQVAPNYTSIGGTGGNGWFVTVTVARGLSGNLYYSTVDEVRFRYSYETLV